MKKGLILLLVALVATLAFAPACAPSTPTPTGTTPGSGDAPIMIKYASAGAVTLPPGDTTVKWLQMIEDRSNGRFETEFYPDRQLGDDAGLLEQTMNGVITGNIGSATALALFTPRLEALQLPFLLNTYDKMQAAYDTDEMRAIYKANEEFNIKSLAMWENGLRHFASNAGAVNSPADLKGLKVRVLPSDLQLKIFSALGANPTPMAYGELYTGLNNKVIDAVEINLTSIYSEHLYEVIDYFTYIGFFPFPSQLIVNLDWWNDLSAADQDMIQTAADECNDYCFGLFEMAELRAVEAMEDEGIQFNTVANYQPFFDATSSVYEEWMAKDPLIKDFVEMARKL
jgi:tripartite ATP-independent transporter DctP family solute receptor